MVTKSESPLLDGSGLPLCYNRVIRLADGTSTASYRQRHGTKPVLCRIIACNTPVIVPRWPPDREEIVTKLTVQFTDELDQVLEDLAEARGLPKTQVLRRAVLLMRYLDEAAAQGADLVLRDKEGNEQRLVLESNFK
jgi:predicted transcriptional regulator